jgi:hypothetical protein
MATVDPTFDRAVNLAEHLGFVRESSMPKWFGDKSADMYVRYGEE